MTGTQDPGAGLGQHEARVVRNPQSPIRNSAHSGLTVALCGNPNSGKTSIFNALTGAHQHVGNWGGVTVEVKEGPAECDGERVTVADLPGTYSLTAYSMEERVARDYVIERRPDVVVQVVDATNLERHLYLTVQLMELGIRPVLALNMWDEVTAKGLRIDVQELGRLLQTTVVTTVGRTGEGVREMLCRAVQQARSGAPGCDRLPAVFPAELQRALRTLSALPAVASNGRYPAAWVALKLLEGDGQIESLVASDPQTARTVRELAGRVEHVTGSDTVTLIAEARYGYIAGALKTTLSRPGISRVEISDRIDQVLTHPVLAYPVFLAFMWLLFQATFVLGEYPAAFLDSVFRWLAGGLGRVLPDGFVTGLVVDGMLRGVGGVASFLPNILILFLGIAVMEDTGYMARAAFIMDKFMHSIGLHGKSFVPVLMGMGCTVPAIMAARTLESPRDRIKTILLTPFISCSAKLPTYVLFAGALFPRHAGAVVFLFNFVFGLTAFFGMGFVLHKTLFREEGCPFVMELPPYRIPTLRSVLIHMWQRAEHYLRKMGGVVLVFTALIWWLGNYPRLPASAEETAAVAAVKAATGLSAAEKRARIDSLESERCAAAAHQTYISRIGRLVEPAVRPLGFGHEAAVALLAGFAAKEVVVSSLGVLYGTGGHAGAESQALRSRIRERFSPLAGFAFMLFVLLYTPCVVALVTIIRELRNWRWSLFSLVYQVAAAWLAAFVVYQGGRLLGLG